MLKKMNWSLLFDVRRRITKGSTTRGALGRGTKHLKRTERIVLTNSEPSFHMTKNDLALFKGRYKFPNEVQPQLPFPNERADTVFRGWICIMRVFLELIVITDEVGIVLTVDDSLALYYPQENTKDYGRYSMYPSEQEIVRYTSECILPFLGLLRKEIRKPPPKALVFKVKLKRLLAQPNRE
ncbi:hypothetical protein TIFTF001_043391 [Ficus carica]|uniref:Uncharacterized protein n=1 Tax=Ficus carica TaxID=3494 RepID=A0AA87Z9F7_FICCA|nr:hypothetical protein TIFTF001_043391 [Ficus carica]